ncbi:hypothetical protein P7K49_029766 [Saguinus oedipus]|uniref:Uncharacterized protein n=1 Tax=Saguinus oedipus TaxID=9490 RepID=A0ABQ9U848_SAGOE|nr:hypothetical protein P7K49_029766 [Saguinus oedipus]
MENYLSKQNQPEFILGDMLILAAKEVMWRCHVSLTNSNFYKYLCLEQRESSSSQKSVCCFIGISSLGFGTLFTTQKDDDHSLCLPVYLLDRERAWKLEAFSRMGKDGDIYSAAKNRFLSADDLINLQHAKAVFS